MRLINILLVYLYLITIYCEVIVEEPKPPTIQCDQVINGDAFFSLTNLGKPSDYQTVLKDGSTLFFNFCTYLTKKCDVQSRDSYALIISSDGQECTRLTADNLFGGIKFSLLDPENASFGLSLLIQDGDHYETKDKLQIRWEAYYQLKCDKSEIKPYILDGIVIDQNRVKISGHSQYGCPRLRLSAIWDFLDSYSFIFFFLLVGVGVFECFLGFRYIYFTLYNVGFATGFGGIVAIFAEFVINSDASSTVAFMICLVAVFFGVLLGTVCATYPSLGFFFHGMWLGTIIAFILNATLLFYFQSQMALWMCIFMFGLSLGVLSCFWWDHLVIIATSVVGAYAIIRPLGYIFPDFPNEFSLVKRLQFKEDESVPKAFWLYLLAIIILAGLGIKIQYQFKKEDELASVNVEQLDRMFLDKGNKIPSRYKQIEDIQAQMNSKKSYEEEQKEQSNGSSHQEENAGGGGQSIQDQLTNWFSTGKKQENINENPNFEQRKKERPLKKQPQVAVEMKSQRVEGAGENLRQVHGKPEQNQRLPAQQPKQEIKRNYKKNMEMESELADMESVKSKDPPPPPPQLKQKLPAPTVDSNINEQVEQKAAAKAIKANDDYDDLDGDDFAFQEKVVKPKDPPQIKLKTKQPKEPIIIDDSGLGMLDELDPDQEPINTKK